MTDDRNLSASDVQTLATRDGVAAFFAALGYSTDTRQPQSVSAMGITAGYLSRQIRHIERIAVHDDGAEPLDSYLVELTSVTVAATQGLARALRNRAGNYLLVLTDDYERLDFVLLQRSLPGTPASPMAARQVSVRPRILTVNRRNPSQVQLRVRLLPERAPARARRVEGAAGGGVSPAAGGSPAVAATDQQYGRWRIYSPLRGVSP